jgi:hypothetical protein
LPRALALGVGTATIIVTTHTLIPDALHHAFATFGALMSPDLPLMRRQHEMITTVVSATRNDGRGSGGGDPEGLPDRRHLRAGPRDARVRPRTVYDSRRAGL